MTTNLLVTTSVENNLWKIVFSITSSNEITLDIFVWENLGTGLGTYMTVATLKDYKAMQTYQVGVDVPVFGNKFLKHTTGILTAPLTYNLEDLVDKIVADVTAFKQEFLTSSNSTQNITI